MESFTDGRLINLAFQGDREAVTDICKLIAERIEQNNSELLGTRFWRGVLLIGNGKTPNEAFEWVENSPRQEEMQVWLANKRKFMSDILVTRQSLSENDLANDDDLYFYVCNVLEALVNRSSPNEAFKWKQLKVGRRKGNVNAFRDWDIKSSVRELLSEGFSFSTACEIVSTVYEGTAYKKSPYDIGYESVVKIAEGITANSDLPFLDGIFPLPKKTGATKAEVDKVKLNFKSMKINN